MVKKHLNTLTFGNIRSNRQAFTKFQAGSSIFDAAWDCFLSYSAVTLNHAFSDKQIGKQNGWNPWDI